MKEYKKLSVCIPAYNEEKSIKEVINSLKKQLPGAEIIVVNDGSSDTTGEILAEIDGIEVITNFVNRGYGASIKRALASATRDAVIWFDADGQHSVGDLKKVAAPVLNGENDMVIGVRGKDSFIVKKRVFGKWILKQTAQIIARCEIPDLNSGLRCFRREVITRYLHLLPDRFSASTVSTLIMMKRNYRIGYCDIKTLERKGKSTVRIFGDGVYAIKLMINLFILFEAFRFFSLIAFVLLIPGMIYGFYIAFTFKRGFPTLAVVLVLCGFMTFLIGIVCNQVTEIRKERFEDQDSFK